MAVLEAVRAGCRPLVPDRLAYREIFPKRFRYAEGTFKAALAQLLSTGEFFDLADGYALTKRFCWSELAPRYRDWLCV